MSDAFAKLLGAERGRARERDERDCVRRHSTSGVEELCYSQLPRGAARTLAAGLLDAHLRASPSPALIGPDGIRYELSDPDELARQLGRDVAGC